MTADARDIRLLRKASSNAKEWTKERDDLIRAMRAEDVPLRTIADVAGLSHTAISKICARG
jgi:hypothetical protein